MRPTDYGLSWWTIFSRPGDEDKRSRAYERKGLQGFCITHESNFEKLQINKWLKQHNECVIGRFDDCIGVIVKDIGAYQYYCRGIWVQKTFLRHLINF
jgi:hypothetical protein